MQEKEITVNNKNFFYRISGEGPVVILLHGFGEDGTVWSNQFNDFSGYTLIIPDLPGSGKSQMIEDMSMEGMANHLALAFGSYITPSPSEMGAVLIGHSMGGYITLAFAEKYPELLNGFVLFHSTAFADSEEKKETRKKGIQFIKQHGAYEFLKITIPDLYSPLTKTENPQIIEEQIALSYNFSDAALVSYYQSMMQRPDRTNILKQTKLPVLFILGKYDNAVSLQDGLKLCHMPDLSYIHILEGSGHMGMKEEPNVSEYILFDYLKSIHHQTQ